MHFFRSQKKYINDDLYRLMKLTKEELVKYFSDLSNRDQDHFEEYPISVAEMRNITQEQVLRYFIKLNTCGKVMSQKQIDKVRKLLKQEDNNG
jgi:hypothetical protein